MRTRSVILQIVLFLCSLLYFLIFPAFLLPSFDSSGRYDFIIKSKSYQDAILFAIGILEHLIPMGLAGLFGAFGGLVRVIIGRDVKFHADTLLYEKVKKPLDEDSAVSVGLIRIKMEADEIVLSAYLGIIGYLIIKSKILVKAFYSGIDIDKIDTGIIGICLSSFIFGLFARRIVSFSESFFDSRILKVIDPKKEDARSKEKTEG